MWCHSEDGGKSCWAYEEFLDQGQVAACGRYANTSQPFTSTGKYDIQGQRVCFVVTQAGDTFTRKAGTRFCSEILAINGQQQRHRDLESGRETVTYKVAASSRQCPK